VQAVPAGSSTLTWLPPAGFVATDYYLEIRTPAGDLKMSWNQVEPPGGNFVEAPLLCPTTGGPVHSFMIVGATNYGPVRATVPVALNGYESNGVPRLFAAPVNGSGDPVVNIGPGHCLLATATRINDATTGQLLPAFVYTAPTSDCGTARIFIAGSGSTGIPAVSTSGAAILALLLLASAGAILRRVRKVGM
jgi:hypothetical protein